MCACEGVGEYHLHLSTHTHTHTHTTGGGFGWMAGAINVALNWRWTFRVLGIGGLVLVPVAAIALWEPKVVQEQRKVRQEGKASYSIKVGGYH